MLVKKRYEPYFAVAGLLVIMLIALAPQFLRFDDLTGHAIYDKGNVIETIAIEDGADADVIIAAADFARAKGVTNTVLTDELTDMENHVLILQKIGSGSATIKQDGTNIIIEGDAVLGLEALDAVISSPDYKGVAEVSVAVDGSISVVDVDKDQGTFVPVEPVESVPVEEAVCKDSDGGKDYYTYGETSDANSGGGDICNGNNLVEHYCSEGKHVYETYSCEDGCLNGACKGDWSADCYDSDGGKDYYIYGETSDANSGGGDICNGNNLVEHYCSQWGHEYETYTCPDGCEDGACLTVSEWPVCGDGVVDDGESCDDGNIVNGDGCTADCTVEVKKGCWETDTGVSGTYSGYYYDYYGDQSESYNYDYSYDDSCYYYDSYGKYYYNDYYCQQNAYDGSWYASSNWEECPSGCEDSTGCVEVETVETSCEDTDAGRDEFTYGETTLINKFGEKTLKKDSCYSYYDDYQYVMENYCYEYGGSTYLYTDYIICNGVCQDGICVEGAEPTCDDSDETDIYSPQKSSHEKGEVKGINKKGEEFVDVDECYDSYGYAYVVEWYCNENDAPYSTYVYCQGGCTDGVCIEPEWEQSCADSDATVDNAGKNIYSAGSVSGVDYYGKDYNYADYCYYYNYYDQYYVVDYYCADSTSYGKYASSYWEECPNGCSEGACNPSEVVVEPTCARVDAGVVGTDQYGKEYTNQNYCNGAAELVSYTCAEGSDGTPYTASVTACDCVDSQCYESSMTVAQFMSSRSPVIVIGVNAATEDNIAAIDLAGATGWKVVTDATISDYTLGDVIAIGGPFANKASAKAMGGEVWDYGPGEALFLVKEYYDGATLVVAGSEASDTRNAVKVLVKDSSSLVFGYGVERVS